MSSSIASLDVTDHSNPKSIRCAVSKMSFSGCISGGSLASHMSLRKVASAVKSRERKRYSDEETSYDNYSSSDDYTSSDEYASSEVSYSDDDCYYSDKQSSWLEQASHCNARRESSGCSKTIICHTTRTLWSSDTQSCPDSLDNCRAPRHH